MRNDKQVGIIAPSDDNLLGVTSSTPTDMLTSVYSRTKTSDGYDLLSLCTAVTPPAPKKKIEGLFKGRGGYTQATIFSVQHQSIQLTVSDKESVYNKKKIKKEKQEKQKDGRNLNLRYHDFIIYFLKARRGTTV